MTENELANKLRAMYYNAEGEKKEMIFLFGIIYAAELARHNLKNIVNVAFNGKHDHYDTELRNGKKLSKYVNLKSEYEHLKR